jgi:hypothetical protein
MANQLLQRTGASWADLFPQNEPNRAAAPTEATPADTEDYSPREEPTRSESFGKDIFGERPAWTPTLSERAIRSGRLRPFLTRIPWPIRLLLGPLTAAVHLSAWTIEGADTVVDAVRHATAPPTARPRICH